MTYVPLLGHERTAAAVCRPVHLPAVILRTRDSRMLHSASAIHSTAQPTLEAASCS